MKIFYLIWQYLVAFPVMIVSTLIASILVIILSPIFGSRVIGSIIPRAWGWFFCKLFLLPVKVEGRENIDPHKEYIFVANHQSLLDIFLMEGYLGHNIKWMMKKELSRIPVFGYACKCAGFIYVDRHSRAAASSLSKADSALRAGSSLAVFAEGTRTLTGEVGSFKRGAFILAHDLNLPIIPVSISGCYDALPKGRPWVRRTPLRLVVHAPVLPDASADSASDIARLRDVTREAVVRCASPK
ncbi:MAG: 1-acyl-sn-glycerol-3-phosphate acyltransferase [Bacteroidaceae bacterium]|nr:1-acyl-sn-glycerol-3-phosphate acyltransferase [Bacteroidaceae bacterium]